MDDFVKKIASESGLPEEKIIEMINEKRDELSGMVSGEGAAHIIAKELGVSLFSGKLKIESIIPGMNVSVLGRIVNIGGIREFSREGSKGRVANLLIADESGSIRLSLWDNEIDKLGDFSLGELVKITGFAREDNTGRPELRLGKFGSIKKSKEEFPSVEALMKERRYDRKNLAEIKENSSASIRASLLQIFEGNIFYYTCPKCNSKLKDSVCSEHGRVEPDYALVLSGIIDDGSDNMRVVLFGENAERLLNLSTDEAKRIFDGDGITALLSRIELGKDFIFEGRVRRNTYFDRLEFVVNNIKNVNVKEEIELLLTRQG
jgi:replication factor A1